MDKPQSYRTVDVVLYDDVNLLDVSGPVQAFKTAKFNGRRKYRMRYLSLDGANVTTCCGMILGAEAALRDTHEGADLLIPGGAGVDEIIENQLLREVIQRRAASSNAPRLISVCSGAMVLAAAGVLDGHKATTHWSRADNANEYEHVNWDLDKICVLDGQIFTSAGITTGIDLALSIIARDCGQASALEVARVLVVQLRRTGGQSQYSIHFAGQFSGSDRLSRLIEQVVTQPHLNWTLDELASNAGMNARTLSRHFKQTLQETPAQFVERVRVDHARGLLADRMVPKQVAIYSGFGDLQRMRRAFQRRFGVGVSEYISVFG